MVFAALDQDTNKEVVVEIALNPFATEQLENERKLLQEDLHQCSRVPRVIGLGDPE